MYVKFPNIFSSNNGIDHTHIDHYKENDHHYDLKISGENVKPPCISIIYCISYITAISSISPMCVYI